MIRKLLLIGNPGVPGDNYTPSVVPVLNRYKEFFKSEVGGFWYDEEIIEEPFGLDINSETTWLALELTKLNKNTDYSVIVFVGHGCAYLGNDYIQFSKGATSLLSCLMAPQGMERIIKRTIIVDACRSFIGATSQQLILEERTFSGDGQLMGNYCREYYDDLVEKCEPHIELLQSTQYGKFANINSDHTGTAFSDALFDTLDTMVPQWNKDALGDRHGQVNKGIYDVLPDVQSGMSIYNQVPEYSRYGGNGDFPLYAVWRAVDRRL